MRFRSKILGACELGEKGRTTPPHGVIYLPIKTMYLAPSISHENVKAKKKHLAAALFPPRKCDSECFYWPPLIQNHLGKEILGNSSVAKLIQYRATTYSITEVFCFVFEQGNDLMEILF